MFTRGYSTLTGAYFAGGLLHVCIIQPYQVINPKVCMLMGLCQPKFSWWFDSPIVNTHLELQRESAVRVLSGSITILQELISQLHQSLGKKQWLYPWLYPFLVAPGTLGFSLRTGVGTGIYTESPGFIPAPWCFDRPVATETGKKSWFLAGKIIYQ